MSELHFQYCQKIVVFSSDKTKVLLAKRKGEADYDGVYAFIGGKMETTDNSIIDGMKREKSEEVGDKCSMKLYPNYSVNIFYKKADGNYMILPHYLAYFDSGDIELNEEYSEYQWIPLTNLDTFEPKVPTISDVVKKLTRLDSLIDENDLIEI